MKRKVTHAPTRRGTTAAPVAGEGEVMFGAELMLAIMLTVPPEHRALFIEAVGGHLTMLTRVAKLRAMAGGCIEEEYRRKIMAREVTALLAAADELLNIVLEESNTYGQACALVAGELWCGPAELPQSAVELDYTQTSRWAVEEFRKARRALRTRDR